MFGLIALDDLPAADGDLVIGIVLLTVLLSVVLHGVTAGPLARVYGERAGQLGADNPEHRVGDGHSVATRHIAENRHR